MKLCYHIMILFIKKSTKYELLWTYYDFKYECFFYIILWIIKNFMNEKNKDFLGSSSVIFDITKKEMNDKITDVFSYFQPIIFDLFCF